jgi:putative DNA primase/helicase
MPGKVPHGIAVRLLPHGKVLGIAEGIETAMSAAVLFGIPVWAALTAGFLETWYPPADVECVYIFGDNDSSYTGQAAAYTLARRLVLTEKKEVNVEIPEQTNTDWNDVLAANLVSSNAIKAVA